MFILWDAQNPEKTKVGVEGQTEEWSGKHAKHLIFGYRTKVDDQTEGWSGNQTEMGGQTEEWPGNHATYFYHFGIAYSPA